MSSIPPSRAESDWTLLVRGWRAQCDVIGALIMRELHTRYGRENVGYVWMVLEPMMLASAVASLHAGQPTHFGSDMRPVPFTIIGYCMFITFRGIVLRSEGALESNLPLLYHRQVTVFDMLLSRAILEGVGTSMTLAVLDGLCWSLGLGDLPARPWALLLAQLLMTWFSFGLSMLVCSLTHNNRIAAKFVHPITYILMPLSGAFYLVKWISPKYQVALAWFPMVQIFELGRYGQFESADLNYVYLPFVIQSCLVLTLGGLLALNVVRRHVHLG